MLQPKYKHPTKAEIEAAHKFAKRISNGDAQADDLAHDTLIRLMRNAPRNGQHRGWLVRHLMARHLRMLMRQQERRRAAERVGARSEVLGAHSRAAEELKAVVRASLAALPEKERVAATRFYLHGRTVRETADEVGVGERAVYSWLESAEPMLRNDIVRRLGRKPIWVLLLAALLPRKATAMGLAAAAAAVVVTGVAIHTLGRDEAPAEVHPKRVASAGSESPVPPEPKPASGRTPTPAAARAATQAEKSEEVPVIGGRVTDEHGRAVAGIWVQARSTGRETAVLTDASGRYWIRLELGQKAPRVSVAVCTHTAANANGWSRYWTSGNRVLAEGAAIPDEPLDIQLRLGRHVELAVDGEAPEKLTALLLLRHNKRTRVLAPGVVLKGGRCVLLLPRGAPDAIGLRPIDTDHQPAAPAPIAWSGDVGRVRLILPRGGTLCGTVRHVAGSKLGTCRVVAEDAKTGRVLTQAVNLKPGVERFEYRLTGLPTGRVRVIVHPERFPGFYAHEAEPVVGTEQRRDILIRDGGTLRVTAPKGMGLRVVNMATGLEAVPAVRDKEWSGGMRAMRVLCLVPGQYTVASRFGDLRQVCQIVAGSTTDVSMNRSCDGSTRR